MSTVLNNWKTILLFLSISLIFNSCSKENISGCMNSKATNFNPEANKSDPCSCEYNGLNSSCGTFSPSNMSIPPVQQQTEVWCWLAVGEMIFRYYGLPTVNGANDYQCGIVGAVGYSYNGGCDACNINCGNCVRPAGSASTISHMINVYPKIACKDLYNSNKTLNSTFVSNFLAESFLKSELDSYRPVIAGINPGSQFVLPGNSQHVALVKGYYYNQSNNLILLVNDPYPYWTKGSDPYINNGAYTNGNLSYEIPYSNFVNGLAWNTSWYSINW